MELFDLGLAYVWEYDDDFIFLTEKILQNAGLNTFRITYSNLHEVIDAVKQRRVGFNCYLDRAWDVDETFAELGKMLNRRKTHIFNPYKNVLHAIDKASMHLEFITTGLNVPYSIIIPPHSEFEDIYISVDDLSILGRPFIIKPCNTTGGGIGVVTGAETLKEVLDERHAYTADKYLIQEKIYPANFNGKRAWFRCFWAFGRSISLWWDDQTHLYDYIPPDEKEKYNLSKLDFIVRKIRSLTGLDFFSTEIVYSTKDEFVVIDYVNDQCDMRLKSKHADGVPDEIVEQIIHNMRKEIQRIKPAQTF